MTEQKLVKFNKVNLHQRYYTSGGIMVPGVTTILSNLGWGSKFLILWAVNEVKAGRDPWKIRDKAGDIGNLSHFYIETYLKNQKPDTSEFSQQDIDKAENCFLSYLDWEKQFKSFEFIESELQLASDSKLYGGTIDELAKINGELCLIDFKTSKAIYDTHLCQAVAYKYLYQENFPDKKIKSIFILRLGKKGDFESHRISKRKERICWDVFCCCLKLHELKKEF